MTTLTQPRVETAFFRDARSFQELRREILPDLIARALRNARLEDLERRLLERTGAV